MNNKLFLMLVLFLIALPIVYSVSAGFTDDMTDCVSMDDSTVDGNTAGNSVITGLEYDIGEAVVTGKTCIVNECFNLSGGAVVESRGNHEITGGDNFSWCWWHKFDFGASQSNAPIGHGIAVENDFFFFFADTELDEKIQVYGESTLETGETKSFVWEHWCVTHNNTGAAEVTYAFKDGVETATPSISQSLITTATNITIGNSKQGHIYSMNGGVDEVKIWTRPISALEAAEDYASGSGVSCVDLFPPADETPPVFNISVPLNNTAVNILPLNFTIDATDDVSSDITCILSNASDIFDEDTGTSGTHFNLTYNSSDVSFQRTMIFNITCFDNDETNNNSAELFLNITIDNVLPVLAITSPVNNSVIDKTFNNLSIDILCTDPNIIALNYSLINMDGIVIDSLQNNTAGTSMILLGERNLANIPTGNFNINGTCIDGHTYFDSKIKYVIKDEFFNKIYYGTESKNDISVQFIESNLNLCDFNTYSLSDREVFWFDFKSCNSKFKGINTYKFILRDNDGKLRYLPNSNYKAHFVTIENFITFQLDVFAKYYVKRKGKDYEITIHTTETFLDFKNSIGGNNFVRKFLNISIIETNYTSLKHFDFLAPTITLDSDIFIPVLNITVNLTSGQHLTFKGSGIIKKVTQPQATEVSGRLIVNSELLFEGSLLSTSDVLSFSLPIRHADLISGQNNISLEIKESAQGAINLTNFIIQGDCDISVHENIVTHSHNNKTVTFTSASFVNIFNLSINKSVNSSSFMDVQHRVENEGAGATTLTCYAESNSTGEITPSYYSYMQSIGESGNTGISYASQIETVGTETWMIYCKTDNGNQIINTLTGYNFLLRDVSKNIVNSFQNQSSSISGLTAGETLFQTSSEFRPQNSTKFNIIATITVQSTSGAHSEAMKFKVNSTTIPEENCLGTSETSFINSNDARTVKFYFECEDINKGNINLTAYATVASGETANILNVSLSGYEVADQPLSFINIPPIVAIISPEEDEILFSINRIEWITTDINNWTTNITAVNVSDATDLTQIATDLGDDILNISYNFSMLGESDFILNITSTENLTSPRLSGSALVAITVRFPAISLNLSSPSNNSVDEDGRVVFKFLTDTANSNNCSLYIDNTINFINQSVNATIGLNSFNEVELANGTHDWLVRCSNSTHQAVSEQWIVHIRFPDPHALSLLICPTTTAGMMFLVLAVAISLFFIFLAFVFRIGIIGVFGSIMLMITSWYLSPCINLFAYVIALFSMFLLIWFALSGLGFVNKTFQ